MTVAVASSSDPASNGDTIDTANVAADSENVKV